MASPFRYYLLHHHLHLLLLFLLFSAVAAAAPTSDLQQLLAFKAALPNTDSLPSWHPSGDPCSSFFGVSCASGARVTSLRLDSLLLSADLRHVAAFLLPLDSLDTLSLRSSNLTGALSSIGRCGGKLREVDLSENAIHGSATDVAGFDSVCGGLRSLNLSGNALGFSAAADGRYQTGLEVLDLSRNRISGPDALAWLLAAGLQELHLSSNAISGSVPAIANCSSLRRLDLSNNSLTGISGDFAACENLAVLNLSSNHIAGAIPDNLFGACASLAELDVSFNNISGAVPADLASCSVLETLNLSNNNLSGVLPLLTLTSMTRLRKLELGFNYFSGELIDSLAKLPELELLDLSSNSLTGSIPPSLCESSDGAAFSLKELYLQNNQLVGSIPASISNCSGLISLDLSFNYLTGMIPSSVGALSDLRDLIMWQNMLEGSIPVELGRVLSLENLILDNNALSGSIPDLSNCINLNWISLSSNLLTGSIPPWIGRFANLAILKMGNNSLSGPIPPEIGDCKSLIWLDLNSNQLNGSIPQTISKQSGKIAVGLVTGKRYVYLRNDGSSDCHGAGNLLEFAGIRPEQLSRVPTRRSCNFTRVYAGSTTYTFNNNGSMIFLDLSYNDLSGPIPPELGDLFYVQVINIGHNSLSGLIPPELGKLRYIGILDLSHNALEGPIPPTFSGLAMLSEFDISNNNLNGSIPDVGQLQTFPAFRYENNRGLCGIPLPPCGGNLTSAGDTHQKSHRRQASLAGSVAMGLLFSLFCIFGVIMIAVESRKRRAENRSSSSSNFNLGGDAYIDSRSHSGAAHSAAWKLTSTREAMSINLAAFENPLRNLTFADLLEATNGFHNDALVGSGGFGNVYKAELKDGTVVAIKKLIQVSGQGDREFTAEMETIGRIKHRNLVPLLGYCKVGEERLLVYEYMKYGSLEDVLHSRKKQGIKLSWAARRKIAIGAARGLAFLHHNCIPHIIHRDMKSSNVLLDDNLEARVSDFGMARQMNAVETHLSVSTLAGTPGYVPPEYYQSFRCTTKGDVYSYGVVLLELLTGRPPTDSSDFGDNNLVGWVKQSAKMRVADVFDKELLKDDPSLELELLEHLKIACACLDDRPLRRPTMLKVMAMFKEIQAGATVDSMASAATTGSVESEFGMVEMSLKECKEEKE